MGSNLCTTDPSPESLAEVGDDGSRRAGTLAGMRVAVVDDSPLFLKCLLRSVRVLGATAQGFSNTDDFFASAETSRPDAVILDRHLNGDDSIALLNPLDELGIPVLMITGDPEGLAACHVPQLTKPIHLDDLARHLRALRNQQ